MELDLHIVDMARELILVVLVIAGPIMVVAIIFLLLPLIGPIMRRFRGGKSVNQPQG